MTVVVSGFSRTPGGRTWKEIESDALLYCGLTGSDDARSSATNGVNECIDRLNMNSWRWLLSSYQFPFTADVGDYEMPNNIRRPVHLEYWNTESKPAGRIEYKTP